MPKKEADYIKKFNESRKIISQFLIIEKSIKKSKNNKPFLELLLQDKTGQIVGRMFNKKAYNEFEKIEEGKIYNIVGKIQEFPHGSNKFNILIERIILANNFNEEEFIIQIENQDSHIEYLINTIHEIEDKELKLLLASLFEDEEFIVVQTGKKCFTVFEKYIGEITSADTLNKAAKKAQLLTYGYKKGRETEKENYDIGYCLKYCELTFPRKI